MTQAKRCRQCGGINAIDATVCPACGHKFTTQFAPPPNQTQAFTVPANPAANPLATVTQSIPIKPAAPPLEWRVKSFWAWAAIVLGLVACYFGTRAVIFIETDETPAWAAAALAFRFHTPQPLLFAYAIGGLAMASIGLVAVSRLYRFDGKDRVWPPATFAVLLVALAVLGTEILLARPRASSQETPPRTATVDAPYIGHWWLDTDPGIQFSFHNDGTGRLTTQRGETYFSHRDHGKTLTIQYENGETVTCGYLAQADHLTLSSPESTSRYSRINVGGFR